MNFLLFFFKIGLVIVAVTGLASANQSWASVIYTEADDSGITLDTARYLPIEIQIISGTLGDNDGADVYGISWEGGVFSAHTEGSDFDTMLSIFNDHGNLLAFNDDSSQVISSLSVFLNPGTYFIGITYYPNNYMGDISYYSNSGINGFYQISIDNNERFFDVGTQLAEVAELPEPSSLALLVIALIAILTIRTTRRGYHPLLAFPDRNQFFNPYKVPSSHLEHR